MTLLELIRQIFAELGFSVPAGVVGAQDATVRQMLALITRFGGTLCREHDWQRLVTESTITTVAGQTKYPLPDDWKKQISQTEWNRSKQSPLLGPQTSQSWQFFKSGIAESSVDYRFRIIGGEIELMPSPAGGETLAFEYVTKNWIVADDGSRKAAFTADNDLTVFDDSLLILGTKILFLQAKGLDFRLDAAQFDSLVAKCKAQDASAPLLSVSPTGGTRLLSMANVPDGNW